MIFSVLLGILGGYLLLTGSLPLRNFRIYSFNSTAGITARLAGLLIWIGICIRWLPVDIPFGRGVLFGLALLLIIATMIIELSGSAK